MFQYPMPKASYKISVAFFFLLQFLLPWLALCTKRPYAAIDVQDIQLTRDYLDAFTLHLTGGLTDPRSVSLPADLAEEASNAKLWTKYIIGSVSVLESVDECALGVIRGFRGATRTRHLSELSEELVKKNDRDTVAHFIAAHAVEYFWDTEFGRLIAELVDSNWDAMRPLLERVLAVLRESRDKGNEYGCILKRMPIEFQYERISSGRVRLEEIDMVYLFDKRFYSLLREIFFQARCSCSPNPQIRQYIARRASWFRQFMPNDLNKAVDANGTGGVEPSHYVWILIRKFMDVETLILVWPLVCRTWNKSHSAILAEDIRVHDLLLQDLSHVHWNRIHTIAPWNHFLNEANSALYLGQCIINGALGRDKLDRRSDCVMREYFCDVMRGKAPLPQARKNGAAHEPFARLLEEGHEAYRYNMPIFFKPPFLTDEEHEKIIYYLVGQKKLAVRLSIQWIIANISRIYSILGGDQLLVKEVIEMSVDNIREVLFVWIMIGQACGIAEETARLVFDEPGTFTQRFIRPVVVKPDKYYDYIADSGMLFEMLKIYYEEIEYENISATFHQTFEFNYFMISFVLFFKNRPDQIEKIVASMSGQLPIFRSDILRSMKDWFGTKTVWILASSGKYSPEDVQFVKEVLTRCGLLNRVTA